MRSGPFRGAQWHGSLQICTDGRMCSFHEPFARAHPGTGRSPTRGHPAAWRSTGTRWTSPQPWCYWYYSCPPQRPSSVMHAHEHRALTVAPTQPYSVSPTVGDLQSTGTRGGTRANATGGMCPWGYHAMTCYPLRDGRAHLPDGPKHRKRARQSHGPQGKNMAPTQPTLVLPPGRGQCATLSEPPPYGRRNHLHSQLPRGHPFPPCLGNFPICVMYAKKRGGGWRYATMT